MIIFLTKNIPQGVMEDDFKSHDVKRSDEKGI